MVTQSRTKTVPYGFICGFPVGGVSSELYGFYEGQGGKSGAQGDAVLAAMKKWGENEAGTAGGTELGFAVCKRGYRPFGEDGERRFGCVKHSARRLEAMRRAPPAALGPPPRPTQRRGCTTAPDGNGSTSGCSGRRPRRGPPRRPSRGAPRRRRTRTPAPPVDRRRAKKSEAGSRSPPPPKPHQRRR